MAGERTLPGLGLRAFWTPGSNNWNAQFDPDMRKLSVLTQIAVISRTTNLPGSPTDGMIYIVPVGQTNANQVAARDNGAWVYFTPHEGFLVHVNDADVFVKWTGAAWEELATGGGSLPAGGTTGQVLTKASETDGDASWATPGGGGGSVNLVIETVTGAYSVTNADLDGTKIKEVNSASAITVTIPTGLTNGQPCQFVQVGAGQVTFAPAGGVTLNSAGGALKTRVQFSSVTLYRRGTDDYILIGDLVE